MQFGHCPIQTWGIDNRLDRSSWRTPLIQGGRKGGGVLRSRKSRWLTPNETFHLNLSCAALEKGPGRATASASSSMDGGQGPEDVRNRSSPGVEKSVRSAQKNKRWVKRNIVVKGAGRAEGGRALYPPPPPLICVLLYGSLCCWFTRMIAISRMACKN